MLFFVRGLTDEERVALTATDEVQISDEVAMNMLERGLISIRHCRSCDLPGRYCSCELEYYDTTEAGRRALRYDDEARLAR